MSMQKFTDKLSYVNMFWFLSFLQKNLKTRWHINTGNKKYEINTVHMVKLTSDQ